MERQKNQLEQSKVYTDHFGEMPQQAAINSVHAYTASGHAQDIVTAWLLEDTTGLDQLTWRGSVSEDLSQKAIESALFLVSLDLKQSNDMPEYLANMQRATQHLSVVDETA